MHDTRWQAHDDLPAHGVFEFGLCKIFLFIHAWFLQRIVFKRPLDEDPDQEGKETKIEHRAYKRVCGAQDHTRYARKDKNHQKFFPGCAGSLLMDIVYK